MGYSALIRDMKCMAGAMDAYSMLVSTIIAATTAAAIQSFFEIFSTRILVRPSPP